MMLHGPLIAGAETGPDPAVPVLLVANHSSWWDGFIVRDVQKRMRPGAPFFTLMSEAELRRHPWLRWMGCIGMESGRGTSVLAAFRRLRDERRGDVRSVFAFYPQGRIWPSGRRPLGFQRGVSVLASLLAPVFIVPTAIHLEPLNRAAATAFVSCGTPVLHVAGNPDHRAIEDAVENELNGILRFLERHGEDAARLWQRGSRAPGEQAGA